MAPGSRGSLVARACELVDAGQARGEIATQDTVPATLADPGISGQRRWCRWR
jgi:hypothetical protein